MSSLRKFNGQVLAMAVSIQRAVRASFSFSSTGLEKETTVPRIQGAPIPWTLADPLALCFGVFATGGLINTRTRVSIPRTPPDPLAVCFGVFTPSRSRAGSKPARSPSSPGPGRGGARTGAAARAGPRPSPGHHLEGGVTRRRMDTASAVAR